MKKLAIIVSLLLAGCGDDVSLVKSQTVSSEDGLSYRYSVLLDDRPLCAKTDWLTYEKNGAKYVEYNCVLKEGDILTNYSIEGEKKFALDVKEKSIEAQKRFFENRLVSLANGNSALIGIVDDFEDRLSDEKKNASYWRTDNIMMHDFIIRYSKTLEGDKAFRTLSTFGWNPIKTKYDPIKVFETTIKSGTKEDTLVLKSILLAVLPDYLKEVQRLITETELASKDVAAIEAKANKQADAAITEYRNKHPVSRKEVLVWTWNKLNGSYLLIDKHREAKMIDGNIIKKALTVDEIKHSVSHNVSELDEYLGDEFQGAYDDRFHFS